jgi:hypothetical protein
MTVEELRSTIDEHRAQLEAIATVRPSPVESFKKYESVRKELVAYERQLSLMLHQETVLPIPNWSIRWNQTDTDVRLVARQWWKAWLAFESLEQTGKRRAFLCEFKNAYASRFTSIDYDNLEHHYLASAGLEGLGAYVVENSQWLTQIDKSGSKLRHFLLCFKSCLIECAAEDVEIAFESDSVSRVLKAIPEDEPPTIVRQK